MYNQPFAPFQFGQPMQQYQGFSQQAYPMPTMPQNTQQTQPQATQSGNIDWIRVNTIEDAKNVMVQPGQRAWIMLANDPIFIVKTADGMGLTRTDAYRFEPYNSAPSESPAYATKDDVQKIWEEIERMRGRNNGKPSKQSVQSGPAAGTGNAE